MMRCGLVMLMFSCLINVGCAFWRSGPDVGPTLGQLAPAKMPPPGQPLPSASLEAIEDSYNAALSVAEDPSLRHSIEMRLADLEMTRSEEHQLAQVEQQAHFATAIQRYQTLLAKPETQADPKAHARVLYRLSKAYAMDGRMQASDEALARLVNEHADSPFAAEADFRRAEQAFSSEQYSVAQTHYQTLVAKGASSPFYLNALYMLGWSKFKSSQFDAAVDTFIQVMDTLPSAQALSSSQQGLMDDTLRVLSLSFTYLDGAEALDQLSVRLGDKPYMPKLYQALSQLYLEKKLYQQAADTLTSYIHRYPESDLGPEFSLQLIDVYQKGGFPDQVLPAKEAFVRQYGVDSAYWAARTDAQHQTWLPALEQLLDELSSYYHAEAQSLAQLATPKKNNLKSSANTLSAQQHYLKAAAYYNQWLRTSPNSPRASDITYLMGDAYFEAEDWASAVAAYEDVAYKKMDANKGGKAGYAAMVALQKLFDQANTDDAKHKIREHKITSAHNFADYYPNEPEAVKVFTQAAQDVFNGGDQARAATMATRITQWQPTPEAGLRKTAWLILAHSQFDTGDFTHAEQAYKSALALMAPTDPDRVKVNDRVAASMFKSSEQLASTGKMAEAILQLQNIESIAPGSDIAAKAMFDAGNHLLTQKNWAQAEKTLLDFQRKYPQHSLASAVSPKLAYIYQENQQWDKAAAALTQMAAQSQDPEARRQSLYLSAELYQKSGRTRDAITNYADYIKRYPQPLDVAMEARLQLLNLSENQKDATARRYWIDDMIRAHAQAGTTATDRSRYLAAEASSRLAGDAFTQFENIKLTLPIKNSLALKKQAMDNTLKAYKQVMNYNVNEFITQANYQVGSVYAQLSRDLLASQRPAELDEMALEEYEVMLEEQAFPIEEKAVEILTISAEKSWQDVYDPWVQKSFDALAKILPARYGKKESIKEVTDALH